MENGYAWYCVLLTRLLPYKPLHTNYHRTGSESMKYGHEV